MADQPPTYSYRSLLRAIIILSIILNTIGFLLRLASRRIGHVKWQLDNTLVLLGWLTFNAFYGAYTRGHRIQWCRPAPSLPPPSTVSTWAKLLLPSALVYTYAVTILKLGIVAVYISYFPSHRPSRIVCYATAVTLCLSMVANTAAGLTICRPLHTLWDDGVAGHCFDINAWLRYGRVVNVVSGVTMLVLPVPHVILMKPGLGLKIAVVIIGLVASIIGLARIPTTNTVPDDTYSSAQTFLWSTVEISMYHLAACMIAYQPLGKWIMSRIRAEPDDVERKEPSFVPRRRVDICRPVRDYGDGKVAFVHEMGSAYTLASS